MITRVIARTGLAAAVAAATFAGVTTPALAAPAEPAAPGAAQAGNGAAGLPGPSATILGGTGALFGPLPAGFVQQAGRPVVLNLALAIGGARSTYANVHFATSNPGTAKGCDMTKIYAHGGEGGTQFCTVTLPAMKPGATQRYWVRMTGTRDGKAFAVTDSVQLYSADVKVDVYVNGALATGRRVPVATKGKATIRYVATNRSAWTIRDLAFDGEYSEPCTTAALLPGKAVACQYVIDLSQAAYQTRTPYGLVMGPMDGSLLSTYGQFQPAQPTALVAR